MRASSLGALCLQSAIDGSEVDIVASCLGYRAKLGHMCSMAHDGELAAYIAYAQAFPSRFLALVDTYDTLKVSHLPPWTTLCLSVVEPVLLPVFSECVLALESGAVSGVSCVRCGPVPVMCLRFVQSGVPNFIVVALALHDIGYHGVGIRLDSGDLAYLSLKTRELFVEADGLCPTGAAIAKCKILASNDINEAVLISLNDQGHSIDSFGIGTNLVTCQAQPALGMVYKLVEVNSRPRIKLSQEVAKVRQFTSGNVHVLGSLEWRIFAFSPPLACMCCSCSCVRFVGV